MSLAVVAFLRELTLETVHGAEHLLPALCADPLPPALRRVTLLLRWTEDVVEYLALKSAHFAALDELRVGAPFGSSPRDEMLRPLRDAFGARVTFLSASDVEP